ncbi:MAG: SDR family oxidoreductase [SAR324 cluster bacterium]|nr:SDR family oxidoreductase [SAR324 cluster bacterium]
MSNQQKQMAKTRILVTGATGYIGGRLVPKLLAAGYIVKALSRSLPKLLSRPWSSHPNFEPASGDVLNLEDIENAVKNCDIVYYLVHSMVSGQSDFETADRRSAENIVTATKNKGVKRIIYLGGLGLDNPSLSKHLRSRREVAQILEQGSVPVTVFNAAMIIGSGSASFEILRYLVDRLPVMVTPKWVSTPVQPIAVANVLEYLIACLHVEETVGRSFDIGVPEILTYLDLMRIYANAANLPERKIIPVPILTPRLSSYWIHLVTPLPAYIARPLAEGLKNPVICSNDEITRLIPQRLLNCAEAISLALERTLEHHVETHWTDSGILPVEWPQPGDPDWSGGTLFEDFRQITVEAPIQNVWEAVAQIGGKKGWYYGNWLWKLRGLVDKLTGGVGLRRGRRDPKNLMLGDAVDFWRVSVVKPPEHLTLFSEMRLPGKALLEFHLQVQENGTTLLKQHARFFPKGILGPLYWYATSPFHIFIFPGMIRGIARSSMLKNQSQSKPMNPDGNETNCSC